MQGLFDHGRLATGQTVLIHGAAGGVGSIAVQLAREAGAQMIGTGRTADKDTALGLAADAFLDLQSDQLEDAGEVDVVFDVIGGDVLDRSAALVRADGTLVTIATPPKVRPKDGRAVFIVVEPDGARLADSPSDCGTDDSSRPSGPCGHSGKRLPRSRTPRSPQPTSPRKCPSTGADRWP